MILLYHINSKSIDYCGADAFCLNSQGGFYMTIKTDLGYIDITNEVLAGIAGYAAA